MRNVPNTHGGTYRKPIKSVRRDKRRFSRTASKTHRLNAGVSMRGGYRL